MPHQLLHDAGGDPGLVGQRGALAAQAVEVEDQAGCVAIGDAGGGQVHREHVGAPRRSEREDRGSPVGKAARKGAQVRGQVRAGADVAGSPFFV